MEKGGNTLGIKRLSNYVIYSITYNNIVLSQMVGHLLGDGSLIMSATSITPYFVFSQTLKRFSYMWHVFLRLYNYCATVPKANTSYRNNVITTNCQVHTRSLSFLSILHTLFYKKDTDGK